MIRPSEEILAPCKDPQSTFRYLCLNAHAGKFGESPDREPRSRRARTKCMRSWFKKTSKPTFWAGRPLAKTFFWIAEANLLCVILAVSLASRYSTTQGIRPIATKPLSAKDYLQSNSPLPFGWLTQTWPHKAKLCSHRHLALHQRKW